MGAWLATPSAGYARAILLLGGRQAERGRQSAPAVGRGTKSPSES